MEPRFLIIETSGRVGQVALALGERIVAERRLDETRRHARDLAPAVRGMLQSQGWTARELNGVIVSVGPGSYTGLRVGIMSAKAFAYGVGCKLFAVETFAAIARQAPAGVVDVITDAQQNRVYWQRFTNGEPVTTLAIMKVDDWLATAPADVLISGPGVHTFRPTLSAHRLVEDALLDPHCGSLLSIAWQRFIKGEADDVWTVEPLYLRPSAAEQQFERRH